MRVAGMRGSSWTIERSRPSRSPATQGPESIFTKFLNLGGKRRPSELIFTGSVKVLRPFYATWILRMSI